jgi:hypothetical protein
MEGSHAFGGANIELYMYTNVEMMGGLYWSVYMNAPTIQRRSRSRDVVFL